MRVYLTCQLNCYYLVICIIWSRAWFTHIQYSVKPHSPAAMGRQTPVAKYLPKNRRRRIGKNQLAEGELNWLAVSCWLAQVGGFTVAAASIEAGALVQQQQQQQQQQRHSRAAPHIRTHAHGGQCARCKCALRHRSALFVSSLCFYVDSR